MDTSIFVKQFTSDAQTLTTDALKARIGSVKKELEREHGWFETVQMLDAELTVLSEELDKRQ